jgi:dolichol-phosphate mannosyltransferase
MHPELTPELAVVVPTLNEAGNVAELYRRLDTHLKGVKWEIIFVDDNSRDETREVIRTLAQKDARVRLLHRVGRRGLASACVEGMMASFAPYCAVMDADLQHDETLLRLMLERMRLGSADIVIGSRFIKDRGRPELISQALPGWRQFLSHVGNWLAQVVTQQTLTDPLSGFFMVKRSVIEEVAPRLTNRGFKILVDIFASSTRRLQAFELPYTFRPRHSGVSKLEPLILSDYLMLLADKTVGRVIPMRFVLFVIVGAVGVLVHMVVLTLCLYLAQLSFDYGQMIALFGAMTANFIGNNWLTYRDIRLKGKDFWLGMGSFYLACSLGAVINYQLTDQLFHWGVPLESAGLLGAIIGSIWNYGVTATFTWRQRTSQD